MNLTRHLSFANVASATALALVLGGGVAVAAGLAPNSVGSKQIKAQAVKSSDVKNDSLRGKDIKESSLGTVPSVESVRVGVPVTAAVGAAPVTVHTQGPLTFTLRCVDGGGGVVRAFLEVRTSVDNAGFAAQNGDAYPDFDVFQGPQDIASTNSASPDLVQAFVTAFTPSGEQLQGYGYVASKLNGSTGCAAQLTFLG